VGRIFFLYGPYEDERRLVSSVTWALLAGLPARTTLEWWRSPTGV
jgi:hypothetical protein